MNAFSTVAEFYEVLTNSTRRLEKEGPLLLEYLERTGGKNVMDIACGTGLHAQFFAEHGANVTAIDLSEEMLEYARAHRQHPSITYVCADMRSLPSGQWDLAISLGNSLSLLSNEDDLVHVFAQLAGCVASRGFVIVQIVNYLSAAAQKPRHRVEESEHGGVEVIAIKNMVPVDSQTLVSLQFFARQAEVWRNLSDWALLRNWHVEDLEKAASQSGFELERVFGSFQGDAYQSETSPDVVAVFRHGSKG